MLRIHDIKLGVSEAKEKIPQQIIKKIGKREMTVSAWKIVRESIDARDKNDIKKVYSVDFLPVSSGKKEQGGEKIDDFLLEVLQAGKRKKLKIDPAPKEHYVYVADAEGQLTENGRLRLKSAREELQECSCKDLSGQRLSLASRPVIVGFGPCGMFAGLLLAQMGYRPLILERGKSIEERVCDVDAFWKDGILNPESNVQFGEGGAGTFSDGKLTTQIKDQRVRKVLSELAAFGGGEELLYKQKPHVGTDQLRDVVVNMRRRICELGGEIRFETKLVELELSDACGDQGQILKAVTVETAEGKRETIDTDVLVLALGHSARDTLNLLFKKGLTMQQKPFSMGVRIEHPQAMINESQYGEGWPDYDLGAAEYKLSHRCKSGRGVYTFCMCPGGLVIGAASEEGGVVTNGMSYQDRGEKNANSGLLVDVKTDDFGSDHPLAGMEFQRKYERLAFEAAGANYRAPAQTLGEFMGQSRSNHAVDSGKGTDQNETDSRESLTYRAVSLKGQVQPSYQPGVCFTDLRTCLPEFAVEAIQEAIPHLSRKLKGFDRPDAVLTAVESRSSSPVRIIRGSSLESNISGIYPGGEGAGYAGGITSAACDGIKIAEAIALKYKKNQ